jgi:hypothetical protein
MVQMAIIGRDFHNPWVMNWYVTAVDFLLDIIILVKKVCSLLKRIFGAGRAQAGGHFYLFVLVLLNASTAPEKVRGRLSSVCSSVFFWM